MPRASSAALKRTVSPVAKPAPNKAAGSGKLGALPEWNLADLYPGLDSPEIKRDLAKIDADCLVFERAYKGKLAALAAGPDAGRVLVAAVKKYEVTDDLLGRLMSYASLL